MNIIATNDWGYWVIVITLVMSILVITASIIYDPLVNAVEDEDEGNDEDVDVLLDAQDDDIFLH